MVSGTIHKATKASNKVKSKAVKEVEIIEVTEEAPSALAEPAGNPLDEVISQAEKARVAYVEAEQQVARTYHGNEMQIARVCQEAVFCYQGAYDAAVALALTTREDALNDALKELEEAIRRAQELFRRAKEKADAAYDETVMQAYRDRHYHQEQSWKAHGDAAEQAWKLYSRISK